MITHLSVPENPLAQSQVPGLLCNTEGEAKSNQSINQEKIADGGGARVEVRQGFQDAVDCTKGRCLKPTSNSVPHML